MEFKTKQLRRVEIKLGQKTTACCEPLIVAYKTASEKKGRICFFPGMENRKNVTPGI